jgi:hypothetical protein
VAWRPFGFLFDTFGSWVLDRYTGIAEHPAISTKGKLANVAQDMLKSSDAFEAHAVGVMDLCYDHDALLTQEVLEAQLKAFDWMKAEGFDRCAAFPSDVGP